MKNKVLATMLAMMSCVALSGCGPEEVSIQIHDLPDVIAIGEEFDVADYVTLKGATSFELDLEEEDYAIAEIDNSVIVPFRAGEINFTVTAGGRSVEGAITAEHGLVLDFAEAIEGIEKEYSFVILSTDSDGYLYTAGIQTHGDNYFYSDDFAYDADDNSVAGGMILAKDEQIYTYYVTEGAQEGEIELEFAISGDEPMRFDEAVGDFAFKASDFVYHPASDNQSIFGRYETLVLPADQAGENYKNARKIFNIPTNYEDYGWKFKSVVAEPFTVVDEDENEFDVFLFTVWFNVPGYGNQPVFMYLLNDEYVEFDPIKEFLAEENVPESNLDTATLADAVQELLDGKNFTLTASCGCVDSETGNPTTNPYHTEEYETYVVYYFAESATATAYVTEDQIHMVNDEGTNLEKGVIKKDDVVYTYTYKEPVNETAGLYAEEKAGATNIFHAKINMNANLLAFGNDEVFDDGTNIYSSIFVNWSEYDEDEKVLYAGFDLSTAFDLFAQVLKSFPVLLGAEDVGFASSLEMMFYATDSVDFSKGCEVLATISYDETGESVIGVSFEVAWPLADGVDFVFSIEFGEVGTTEIPAGIDIIYPVEE